MSAVLAPKSNKKTSGQKAKDKRNKRKAKDAETKKRAKDVTVSTSAVAAAASSAAASSADARDYAEQNKQKGSTETKTRIEGLIAILPQEPPILDQSATIPYCTTHPLKGRKLQNRSVSQFSCKLTNNFLISERELALLKQLSSQYLAENSKAFCIDSPKLKPSPEFTKHLFLADTEEVGTSVFINRDFVAGTAGGFIPYSGVIRVIKKSELYSGQHKFISKNDYLYLYATIGDYHLICDARDYRGLAGFFTDSMANDENDEDVKEQQEVFEIVEPNLYKAQSATFRMMKIYMTDLGVLLPYWFKKTHKSLKNGEMLTVQYSSGYTNDDKDAEIHPLKFYTKLKKTPRIHIGGGEFVPENQVLFKNTLLTFTDPKGNRDAQLFDWSAIQHAAKNPPQSAVFSRLRFLHLREDNQVKTLVFMDATLDTLLKQQGQLYTETMVDCLILPSLYDKLITEILNVLGHNVVKQLKKGSEIKFFVTFEEISFRLNIKFSQQNKDHYQKLFSERNIAIDFKPVDGERGKYWLFVSGTSRVFASLSNLRLILTTDFSKEMTKYLDQSIGLTPQLDAPSISSMVETKSARETDYLAQSIADKERELVEARAEKEKCGQLLVEREKAHALLQAQAQAQAQEQEALHAASQSSTRVMEASGTSLQYMYQQDRVKDGKDASDIRDKIQDKNGDAIIDREDNKDNDSTEPTKNAKTI